MLETALLLLVKQCSFQHNGFLFCGCSIEFDTALQWRLHLRKFAAAKEQLQKSHIRELVAILTDWQKVGVKFPLLVGINFPLLPGLSWQSRSLLDSVALQPMLAKLSGFSM